DSPFQDLTIERVVIENGVTNIGNYAFYGCSELRTITIPDGVTSFGDSAFNGCSELRTITIPDGVTRFGASAFYGCSSLTSIEFPASMTTIGDKFLYGCSSLAGILVDADNPNYTSSGGVMFTKDMTRIVACPQGFAGTYAIPDGVTTINYEAFYGCENLTCITIPDSVTIIRDQAFCGCSSLTSIVIPDGVTSMGSGTFSSCTSLTAIAIPDGVTSIGTHIFSNCTALKAVTIPARVTSVVYSAFLNCTSLENVYFTGTQAQWNAIAIGSDNECLTNATLHCLCTTLPESLHPYLSNSDDFYYYSHPEAAAALKVTFSSDTSFEKNYDFLHIIDSTGNETIYTDDELAGEEIVLPGSSFTLELTSDASVTDYGFRITSIEAMSEEEYGQYTLINDLEYELDDGTYTITGYTGPLSELTIPSEIDGIDVTRLGNWAFHGCNGLRTITIPDSVTSFGYQAFLNCRNLTTFTIPASVTSIGFGPFSGCSNLTAIMADANNPAYSSVGGVLYNKDMTTIIACPKTYEGTFTIPYGVTTIGDSAFNSCRFLTGITIPDSVTIIEHEAFSGCRSLTGIIIPAGVSSLGNGTFSHCTSLKTITIPDGVTQIGTYIFDSCTAMTAITIPDSVTRILDIAFWYCTSLTDVFFTGTQAQWNAITIGAYYNDCLTNATLHCLCATLPESLHPYLSNSDDFYLYAHPNASAALKVMFSSDTSFERGFDYLYITDSTGKETRYTGTDLAGAEIVLPGTTFTLEFTSDGSVTDYGFRITSIEAMSMKNTDSTCC
ncbi:MAG: leucine-rich repeat domain-containing protein, partial [Clostridia bacterium]|nr:leucine-rich repeat domain-containing protein [Clostridia bacterium]